MIENIHEILSDFKRIKENVEEIVRDVIHNDSIPLIIRADILLKSGIASFDFWEDKDICLEGLLEEMSNPDLSEVQLEGMYELLEYMVKNELKVLIRNYE